MSNNFSVDGLPIIYMCTSAVHPLNLNTVAGNIRIRLLELPPRVLYSTE